MNKSLSFDRAADIYDRTRDFPEPVATLGIRAILDAAGPGARFLDVGTGTGRISVPLLRQGAHLIGCDLSPKMLAVLRQKDPSARLAEADASALPFPTGHFGAVTTCHVMHLVAPWREALREYRRILRPGGVYINVRTEEDDCPGGRIEDYWESRVKAHGESCRRPGVENEDELQSELRGMGAIVERVAAIRYTRSHSLESVLERIANRVDSQTWNVPEPTFTATVQETRQWAVQEFGELNLVFQEPSTFIVEVARFGAAGRGSTG